MINGFLLRIILSLFTAAAAMGLLAVVAGGPVWHVALAGWVVGAAVAGVFNAVERWSEFTRLVHFRKGLQRPNRAALRARQSAKKGGRR